MARLLQFAFLISVTPVASAQPAKHPNVSLVEKAERLKPGQFIWNPGAESSGSLFLVVELTAQRVMLYRDGVPVAASTISTGSKGRETPTGAFTILQKEIMHRSRTYDDAPMPYMQRLTIKGVAMHAGHLPGYPASHGCIRLPKGFAKLLYGVTTIGTPVLVIDAAELASNEGKLKRTSAYSTSSAERKRSGRRPPREHWPILKGEGSARGNDAPAPSRLSKGRGGSCFKVVVVRFPSIPDISGVSVFADCGH